jgi:hydroxyacylglutathione hydrolase
MRSSFLIFETGSPNALFCGDTLFVGGCGRFFEGTGDDMVKTFDLFKKLDPYTEIFCGHEYTLDNLKFALTVSKYKAKESDASRIWKAL